MLLVLAAHVAPAADDVQSLINQGQYQAALARLDDHLQRSPHDADARFTRGLVLVHLGRRDDAVKAFADLTRDYPQLPEPYNNLAVLYAQQGDYERARDALEAALATHPSYATAHENLGDIYSALASAAYNRALQLDQDNSLLRQKLRLMEQMNTLPAEQPVAARERAPARPPEVAFIPPPRAVAEPDAPTAETISAAVYDWAQAWSRQDVSGYLAAYGKDFLPEGGLSRNAWESQRHSRISAPQRIRVRVVNPQIDLLDEGHARVTFLQEYESDTYSDQVTKVLELHRRGGAWRITREYSP